MIAAVTGAAVALAVTALVAAGEASGPVLITVAVLTVLGGIVGTLVKGWLDIRTTKAQAQGAAQQAARAETSATSANTRAHLVGQQVTDLTAHTFREQAATDVLPQATEMLRQVAEQRDELASAWREAKAALKACEDRDRHTRRELAAVRGQFDRLLEVVAREHPTLPVREIVHQDESDPIEGDQ